MLNRAEVTLRSDRDINVRIIHNRIDLTRSLLRILIDRDNRVHAIFQHRTRCRNMDDRHFTLAFDRIFKRLIRRTVRNGPKFTTVNRQHIDKTAINTKHRAGYYIAKHTINNKYRRIDQNTTLSFRRRITPAAVETT